MPEQTAEQIKRLTEQTAEQTAAAALAALESGRGDIPAAAARAAAALAEHAQGYAQIYKNLAAGLSELIRENLAGARAVNSINPIKRRGYAQRVEQDAQNVRLMLQNVEGLAQDLDSLEAAALATRGLITEIKRLAERAEQAAREAADLEF